MDGRWGERRPGERNQKPAQRNGTLVGPGVGGWLVGPGASLSMGTEATICGEAVSWWMVCHLVIVGMAGAPPC